MQNFISSAVVTTQKHAKGSNHKEELKSSGAADSLRIMGLTADDIKACITLRTLNYGNYGILLIMGSAGFITSTDV